MAGKPIIFSDEFKGDAVALNELGISQKQVVEDLGMSKSALRAWVHNANSMPHGTTPSKDPDEQHEMRQAFKRIRELELKIKVLRCTAAYL